MSEKNKGVSFSSHNIPEEMCDSMVSTAFSGAVELHDLVRNMGATVDQAGFALGLAGSLFVDSLRDERKEGFDDAALSSFINQVSVGLMTPASCGIEHVNTVLENFAGEVDPGVMDEDAAMELTPVDVSALTKAQRDLIGRAAGVMAMDDLSVAIKDNGLKPCEVAFMYGLAARILTDVMVKTGLMQKDGAGALAANMLAGFSQGMSQPVGVDIVTVSEVSGISPPTVH